MAAPTFSQIISKPDGKILNMNILEHAKYTHVKSKDSYKVAKILGLFLKVDTFIGH